MARELYVTKADGRSQAFDRQKIMRTCLRLGVTQDVAEKIVSRIEKEAYDGIPTKKIIKLIFRYVRKYRPEFKHIIDLRDAICMLRPKPDFELFIAQLLREYGFKVKSNQMVAGKCIEHEIDAVAEKNSKEVYYVEVKHHYKPHTYTGLDVFLEVWATFEDLIDGYKEGRNKIPFTGVIVISNTKLSDHAYNYAMCRNIKGMAWNTPRERGLESMISDKRLYPITLLRGLDPDDQAKLGDAGIVTLKQIIELDEAEIRRMTRLSKKAVKELKQKSKEILSK